MHQNSHRLESFFFGYIEEVFTCRDRLTSHVKVHTYKKPFPFKTCGGKNLIKAFIESSDETHTGEVPKPSNTHENVSFINPNLTAKLIVKRQHDKYLGHHRSLVSVVHEQNEILKPLGSVFFFRN